MPPYANAIASPRKDGVLYCQDMLLPAAEGDLFNLSSLYAPDPAPVDARQAVMATLTLTGRGIVISATSYVVLQTDLGDGKWIDVAWIRSTAIAGPDLFLLSGGVAGANAFQQTRLVGTAPIGHGSNQFPLGGRIRFVGKSTAVTQAASSASGGVLPPGILCTIRYKLLGLR